MDVDYQLYGLTQSEAIARGIRPVDYVEIELPEFTKEATEIPLELKQFIEGYDFIWTLTVERSYAERRGWNDMLAFREFLQNSLDEEHEVYGYDAIHVDIIVDDIGTWIRDRGRGIRPEAFMLGGFEKKCELRGAFGEGLKIAALWFSTHGHDIYAFTKNIVYRVYYSSLANALVVVFGRAKWNISGTDVLIHRYYLPEEYKLIYYRNAGFTEVCRAEYSISQCDVSMPNLILLPPGYLYVRDIYVNTIYNLTGYNGYYSYNLWWVGLEPNRIQVQSTWDLEYEVFNVLIRCPQALCKVLEDCMVLKEYGGVTYYLLDNKYYETNIDYRHAFDETLEAVKNLMESKGITAYSDYGDLDGVTAVGHEGGVAILVPKNLHPLFKKMSKASEFVIKSLKKLIDGAVPVDERKFTSSQRGFIRECRLLTKYALNLPTKIVVIEGTRSFYNSGVDTVFLAEYAVRARKLKTFIHEISHAYGVKNFGDAPDVTEKFERALENVGSRIYDDMIYRDNLRYAVSRAKFGGIYAEPKGASDYFGLNLKYKNMSPTMFTDLLTRPKMFILSVDNTYFDAFGYIDFDKVPVEEHYNRELEMRARVLKNEIARYMNGEISFSELYDNLVAGLGNVYFPDTIRLIKNKEFKELCIYTYSLEEDRYIMYDCYRR